MQEAGSLELRAKKPQQTQAAAGLPQHGGAVSAAERAIRAVQRPQPAGQLPQELFLCVRACGGARVSASPSASASPGECALPVPPGHTTESFTPVSEGHPLPWPHPWQLRLRTRCARPLPPGKGSAPSSLRLLSPAAIQPYSRAKALPRSYWLGRAPRAPFR